MEIVKTINELEGLEVKLIDVDDNECTGLLSIYGDILDIIGSKTIYRNIPKNKVKSISKIKRKECEQ